MGFNWGGGIAGAISGAASGFMMGGPYGAAAGGILGGVSGGLGPTSQGGITGGRKGGEQAAEYYDAAFPGTNPWERLGAGNPIGQMASAQLASKTQTQNVAKQVGQQAMSVTKQTGAQVKIAKIQAGAFRYQTKVHGRIAAMGHSENRPPGTYAPMATSLTDEPTAPHGISTPGGGRMDVLSRQAGAAAATSQAATSKSGLLIKGYEAETKRGQAFRSPEEGALAVLGTHVYEFGMRDQKKWQVHAKKHFDKYLAAGVAAHVINKGADAVGKVLGVRQRAVPARGSGGNRFPTKTSVRGSPRASSKVRIKPYRVKQR